MPSPRTVRTVSSFAAAYRSRPLRRISSTPNSSRRVDLVTEPEPLHPDGLHRVDGDDAPAVELGVEERIGNPDGHLVAQLRCPHRVAIQENVRHRSAILPRIGRVTSPVERTSRTLRERLAEVSDLYRTMGVLGWDQRVTMPSGGTAARAEALATLGRIAHEKFTDEEIGGLLEKLRPHRGVARPRLRRREPDPGHAPRLGEERAGPRRAPRRDAPRRGPGASGLGRGTREQRLRRPSSPSSSGTSS